MRLGGTVDEWSPEQGFGFITGEDGQRYWAHFIDLTTGVGFAELHSGQSVTFQWSAGDLQDGVPHAREVAVEGEPPRTPTPPDPGTNIMGWEDTRH